LQSKIWRAFGVGPKRKVVPLEIIYQHAKFGEFWAKGISSFVFLNWEILEQLESDLIIRKRIDQAQAIAAVQPSAVLTRPTWPFLHSTTCLWMLPECSDHAPAPSDGTSRPPRATTMKLTDSTVLPAVVLIYPALRANIFIPHLACVIFLYKQSESPASSLNQCLTSPRCQLTRIWPVPPPHLPGACSPILRFGVKPSWL
jgi:hypothetical protein